MTKYTIETDEHSTGIWIAAIILTLLLPPIGLTVGAFLLLTATESEESDDFDVEVE